MTIAATLDSLAQLNPLSQIEQIRRGLPARAWPFVASLAGVGKQELAKTLKLNPRTLQRRSTLNSDEAERILRVFHVIREATAMCQGDRDAARNWLHSPVIALGGNRPVDLLDTELGTSQVLNVIRAVIWGVYL